MKTKIYFNLPTFFLIVAFVYSSNFFFDFVIQILMLGWCLILISYGIGRKTLVYFKIQLTILVGFGCCVFLPKVFERDPIEELMLYDDLSSIKVELYEDGSFKSQSNMVFGFYENWSGRFVKKGGDIIFDVPYYTAMREYKVLYKSSVNECWVMDEQYIHDKRLKDFQCFNLKIGVD